MACRRSEKRPTPAATYFYSVQLTLQAFLREKYKNQIEKILAQANQGATPRENKSVLTLAEFIEQSYFLRLEWRLTVPAGNELHIEPSTVKGYKDIFRKHIENSPVAKIRMQAFTPRDAQRFIEGLPQTLSHQTHLRVKNFLSGVFTWAISDGALTGTNPVDGVKVGGSTKKAVKFQGLTATEKLQRIQTNGHGDTETLRALKKQALSEHAYTLEEVADMLGKRPEPARTVCATAAFTGLTRSELRGLKWTDYDGQTLMVQRKVWEGHIGAPKTEAREAGVYIIPLLRKILAKYKTAYPPQGDGWIFRGERLLRPLDLDNLAKREIQRHINGAWFGRHAFRRGLGTRLNEAGVDDKDIQSILRHADVSTTQAFYILPSQERAEAGLKKLDKTLRTKYGIKA